MYLMVCKVILFSEGLSIKIIWVYVCWSFKLEACQYCCSSQRTFDFVGFLYVSTTYFVKFSILFPSFCLLWVWFVIFLVSYGGRLVIGLRGYFWNKAIYIYKIFLSIAFCWILQVGFFFFAVFLLSSISKYVLICLVISSLT